MTMQRARDYLRQNFIFCLTGILVVLGIKYYYSQADCDSLLWILAPTSHWVEFLSKIPLTYIPGTGYVNHSLRLLIAPSCSGVQFMIITFATLVFSFVHNIASPQTSPLFGRSQRLRRGFGWIAASIFFSWLFTVFINGLRIITAIYLPLYLERIGLMGELLTPDRVHTMIGIVVYFTALLTLYRLVGYRIQRLSNTVSQSQETDPPGQPQDASDGFKIRKEQFAVMYIRKCMPPIFWYFAMTLGLPFLNRAYLKDSAKFTELTVLVICCLIAILLPHFLLSLLRSRKKI